MSLKMGGSGGLGFRISKDTQHRYLMTSSS
jgi:hypothetical protein